MGERGGYVHVCRCEREREKDKGKKSSSMCVRGGASSVRDDKEAGATGGPRAHRESERERKRERKRIRKEGGE